MKMIKQEAPWPNELEDLINNLSYKPGWKFILTELNRGHGCTGLTLVIETLGYNSYRPEDGEIYTIEHFMPVPPMSYNRESWLRWLFKQILLVENHEACEFFKIGGERPYGPIHGRGRDHYMIFEST